MAKAKRAVSVYEEFKHPNEEEEHEDVDPGLIDKDGNRVGWTGSKFYLWFSQFDENTLRPAFIRNYDRDVIILEDEY